MTTLRGGAMVLLLAGSLAVAGCGEPSPRGHVVRKEHPQPDVYRLCIRNDSARERVDCLPVSEETWNKYQIGDYLRYQPWVGA